MIEDSGIENQDKGTKNKKNRIEERGNRNAGGYLRVSQFSTGPYRHKEGDVDIAVYFWTEKGVEWENVKGRYEGEIEDVLMATGLVLETLLWVYRMNLWGIV